MLTTFFDWFHLTFGNHLLRNACFWDTTSGLAWRESARFLAGIDLRLRAKRAGLLRCYRSWTYIFRTGALSCWLPYLRLLGLNLELFHVFWRQNLGFGNNRTSALFTLWSLFRGWFWSFRRRFAAIISLNLLLRSWLFFRILGSWSAFLFDHDFILWYEFLKPFIFLHRIDSFCTCRHLWISLTLRRASLYSFLSRINKEIKPALSVDLHLFCNSLALSCLAFALRLAVLLTCEKGWRLSDFSSILSAILSIQNFLKPNLFFLCWCHLDTLLPLLLNSDRTSLDWFFGRLLILRLIFLRSFCGFWGFS